MERELWYAVNGTGQAVIFVQKPERDEHFRCWKGHMISCYIMVVSDMISDGFQLPVITWKDEPVKITLSIKTD